MNDHYLTTKEVAAELNLSIHTIYKYVREGKLTPVYEDSWQIDQTHLFRKEDIENLKEELKKPGLTTSEVADRLGVHPTTVNSYINQGILKATKHHYRGREIYFINEEDLKQFKIKHHDHMAKKDKSFYSKEKNLYLYQMIINTETNEIGRIMELNEDQGKILLETGETIPINQMLKKGFFPKEQFKEHNHITKPGYAKFKFPKPQHISSPVFNIIELFYRCIGYKNIKLFELDNVIHVEVKPHFIQSENHKYEFELLKEHISKGRVIPRHNGVVIESDIELVTIQLPIELKKQIMEKSKQRGITVSDFIVQVLEEYNLN